MHELPLLDQLAVKVVAVVPLLGLSDAEQVGGADTLTVFESHITVPPGPVATSVAVWLPAVGNEIGAVPVQAIAPWFTPSSFQVHDVPSLDQATVNIVAVVPLLGLSDPEQVGGPDTLAVFESHATVPPGPVATSASAVASGRNRSWVIVP